MGKSFDVTEKDLVASTPSAEARLRWRRSKVMSALGKVTGGFSTVLSRGREENRYIRTRNWQQEKVKLGPVGGNAYRVQREDKDLPEWMRIERPKRYGPRIKIFD